MASSKNLKANQTGPLEKQLWKAGDKLRKNIDAAEYMHVVLGLIFLKYIPCQSTCKNYQVSTSKSYQL